MALPSIRKLAQRYKVNPATVVRALHILRNQKIIYSNRTKGFYVCEDISQVRQNLAEQVISDFLHNMSGIGYSNSDIQRLVEEVILLGKY